MHPKSDEEEHKQDDQTRRDSKAMVIALTQKLGQNRLDEAPRKQPRVHASIGTTASLATAWSNNDNTGNSSSNVNDFCDLVEESFPLPDFLAESHLRAGLHRAANAHLQEAISDEAPSYPFFPPRAARVPGGERFGTLDCPGFPSFNVARSVSLSLFSCSITLSGTRSGKCREIVQVCPRK